MGRSSAPAQFGNEASPVSAFNALLDTIGRLERIIDLETATLSERRPVAFDDLNRKKNHGVLELRRAIDAVRGLGCEALGLDPKPHLTNLRGKLKTNLTALRRHLDAARAVAAVIARTIEDQESDGTYTPAVIRKETIA